MKKKVKKLIKPLILVLFIAVVVFLGKYFDLVRVLNKEFIQSYVSSFGVFAPLVFGMLYFIGTVIFFPGTPLSISGGLLFGIVKGTAIIVVSATLGSVLAFMIARTLGKGFVDKLLKNKFHKLEEYDEKIAKNGFMTVLFLRLIPLFPFTGLNFALGLTKVRVRDYFLATLVGIIPGSLVLANIGASANDISSPQFYLSILLFFGLMFIPAVYKKVMKTKNSNFALEIPEK